MDIAFANVQVRNKESSGEKEGGSEFWSREQVMSLAHVHVAPRGRLSGTPWRLKSATVWSSESAVTGSGRAAEV